MPNAKHTDTHKLLSAGVMVKYHSDNKPSKPQRSKLIDACDLSRKIMRETVWKFDKMAFFRQKERTFEDALNTHFSLDDAPDRRKRNINYLRGKMLHVSFFMQSGIYLIDSDARMQAPATPMREKIGGRDMPNNVKGFWGNVEGYVSTGHSVMPNWMISGGPIHVNFGLASTYSAFGLARLIIHEATHRYIKTVDHAYNHDGNYAALTSGQKMENADSFAYAALSRHTKRTETWATLSADGHH